VHQRGSTAWPTSDALALTGRATRVPHQTDKRGTERTTAVNSTTLMSWPPPL
jgi:hypothetical protein